MIVDTASASGTDRGCGYRDDIHVCGAVGRPNGEKGIYHQKSFDETPRWGSAIGDEEIHDFSAVNGHGMIRRELIPETGRRWCELGVRKTLRGGQSNLL